MNNLIFIYGTLKKGESNHSHMKGSKYIGNAKSVKKYIMHPYRNSDFPCLFNESGKYNIEGELYKVSDEKMVQLDYFEGVPNLFDKEKIDVIDEFKNIIKANVYFCKLERKDLNVKIEKELSKW